ncbi:hypothetical protein, partial [Maricaulis sp.]|uniref:hypothetical protein n=1 Tax=Maricaulis sp. TaxID=1486257 RepID=UPI0026348738
DKLQAYGCGLHAAQDLIAGARQTRCRRLWLALRRFLTRDEALDALTSGGSEAVMFMGGRKRSVPIFTDEQPILLSKNFA